MRTLLVVFLLATLCVWQSLAGDCSQFTDVCSCTNSPTCGYCQTPGTTFGKCYAKETPSSTGEVVFGEATCRNGGNTNVWLVGPQSNCVTRETVGPVSTTKPVEPVSTTKPVEPVSTTRPVEPTGPTTVDCSKIDKCNCLKYDICGLCQFPTNGEAKCIVRSDAGNVGYGETTCKNAGGTWYGSATSTNVCPSSTTKPVEPTTRPVEPTGPTTVDCRNIEKCYCYKYEQCGLCRYGTDSKCLPRTDSTNTAGELTCKNGGGSWAVGSAAMCPSSTTKPVEPTSKPVEPTRPNPEDCYYFRGDLCGCTKSDFCGMCVLTENNTVTAKKCLPKTDSTNTAGELTCKNYGGTWRVGAQRECTAGEYHEAEVKGVVTVTVTDAVTTAIEQVVQKLVAEKLNLDPTKVDVNVETTTNSDGTSSFKVTIRVGDAEVTSDKFSELSNLSTSDLEKQLAEQGVNTQSATVNIANNTGFAGKLVASLLMVAVISFLF